MPYIAFFQISRSTNLDDWVHDPNLFSISRVVAYDGDDIYTDLDIEQFRIIENIEQSLITLHQLEAYNKFLSTNNIETQDINKSYIVYNMNFNITNIPEENPELERT